MEMHQTLRPIGAETYLIKGLGFALVLSIGNTVLLNLVLVSHTPYYVNNRNILRPYDNK